MGMISLELYNYGIENTCKEVETILRGVLGQKVSKQEKDIAIAKAMGMVSTIYNMTIPSVTDTRAIIEEENC
jgi:hypothetical protein